MNPYLSELWGREVLKSFQQSIIIDAFMPPVKTQRPWHLKAYHRMNKRAYRNWYNGELEKIKPPAEWATVNVSQAPRPCMFWGCEGKAVAGSYCCETCLDMFDPNGKS